MRIAWLQDMEFQTPNGGAQMTDWTHFVEGIKRGHDMVPAIAGMGGVEVLSQEFDGFIVSNCRAWPLEVLHRLRDSGAPYAVFAHDYDCRWRLFFSMEDRCHECYLRERWLTFHQKAALRIWLSPLHQEAWLWVYPELKDLPYAIIPSPVSPKEFYPLGRERKGVIAVNSHLPFKGREQFLAWADAHPEVPITLVGTGPSDDLPGNITAVGRVAYAALNELYNQHEAFLHLPQNPSPYDRTVAEAFLAGCRLVVNDNVGATSFPEFSQGREAVAKMSQEAPRVFWDNVERAFR